MKNILVIILLGIIGYYSFVRIQEYPFGSDKMEVGRHYLNEVLEETGSANTVTAIVVSYRGFDTLGEVTVLFLAATGLGTILFDKRRRKRYRQQASPIVKRAASFFYPIIILFGVYVFLHGHLTPGGGFQGGAIIATGMLMMFMAHSHFEANHNVLMWIESLAGLSFVSIGIFGLVYGGSFLQNFLPLGTPNQLLSAGVIPLIYAAVGFKVGAELTGVLDTLLKTLHEEEK
ncbi:MAG: Na(+)/H(+) antiporter subunit B [Candidatus Marinimicrobia bacterium]|nr:Na(+)/H(+) antiporter subunit B [Candidatus Neomarinimicrobiota bacterium]